MPVVRTIKAVSSRKPAHLSRTDGGKNFSLGSRKQSGTSQQCKPKSITIRGQKLVPTVVFDTFWHFASERKAMDDKRRAGMAEPWTNDPILRRSRFCNTFRILDRASQFIVAEVIEKGSQEPTELVFRIVLFNLFSKIETYELLQDQLGPLTWATYDRHAYEKVLDEARDGGMTLYTGAFQKPAPKLGYKDAFANHLELLELLMQDLPGRLSQAEYIADVFDYIVSFPGMGDFSAFQLLLNLTYSRVLNFSESDFVVAGLGAHSGLSKMFGESMARAVQAVPGMEMDVMRWLQETQDEQFKRLGIDFSGLGPDRLPMQLCDIEHTLCEVDKYARIAHPNIRGLHGRTQLRGSAFRPSPAHSVEVHVPKAWSHPDRKIVRIRPGGPLKVRKRYVVSSIVDHRTDANRGVEYKVHWWGYSNEDDTWEPEDELREDAAAAIEAYLTSIGKS